jgi:acyl-CoA thioesterase
MPTDYKKLILDKMYQNDAYSQWLGIEIFDIRRGYAKIAMTVRPEMCNGFKIAHGGISYSLADTALAFASNTYKGVSVSIETQISHLAPINSGDQIIAIAEEIHRTHKIGVYTVKVLRSTSVVAHFKGTIYHKGPKAP